MPPDDLPGLDDADLPGLDDAHPNPEPDQLGDAAASGPDWEAIDDAIDTITEGADAEASGRQWTNDELDEWFENDFGGESTFKTKFGDDADSLKFYAMNEAMNDDLQFSVDAYFRLDFPADGMFILGWDTNPWQRLGLEAKTRFRRGWVDYQASLESVVGELAPYGPDYSHPSKPGQPSLPRWMILGGGFGILGLVLAVGLFLSSGDTDDTAAAVPSETAVEDTAPPSTEAVVVDTDAPAVALEPSVVSAVAFPTLWTYTATKSASIVPAPDFVTSTPIGAAMSWAFNVNETCNEDACTHVTVIDYVDPGGVIGEIPETTWMVDGAEWSLDVTYHTGQSSYGDGTACVIRNREVFELTITEELIDGRSIPTAFVGTWLRATSLDLEASTGNVALLCGDFWEFVDEWSLVGVASN